jgi:hypothetical protein
LIQREEIEVGSHVIGIYSDKNQKIDETFNFLRKGLERREALLLITSDLEKDEIRKRMEKDWGVNVRRLEAQGDILLQTPDEWYFKEGWPNWPRTNAMFLALERQVLDNGRLGLRGAGDTGLFFERGFASDLMDYESGLERKFNIAFTALCTYNRADFEKLTSDDIRRLREHHFLVT